MQIIFEVSTHYGIFRDALNIDDDSYLTLTQDDINQMQHERVNNWLAIVGESNGY